MAKQATKKSQPTSYERTEERQSYEQRAEPTAITVVESRELQAAVDHFNQQLFDGQLPDVFVRYETKANSEGFYSPSAFAARDGKYQRDCIALNSDRFVGKTDKQILADLGHLLCHHWQEYCGEAPTRHYHDEQWSQRMVEIGLQPSSTGAAGGKITGKKMSHFIIQGGRFDQSCEKLFATGWKLNLQSTPRPGPKVKTRTDKTKKGCPACNDSFWGKSVLNFGVCAADIWRSPRVPTRARSSASS